MRVLITGGAGFLGSHIVDQCLIQGHAVLVIDNLSTGNMIQLPEPQDGLDIVIGSIADFNLVASSFKTFQPTHVVHAAASYKNPMDWQEDIQTNALGSCHLFKLSREFGVRRFVYLQTALCYGSSHVPVIPEDHFLNPLTSYSISKTVGEHYGSMSQLKFASLRLANIYGPRHYSGPIPTFYQKIKSDQTVNLVNTRRDFIEISDFLELFDKVLKDETQTGVFNVSGGETCTIPQLYETMVRLMRSRSNVAKIMEPEGEDVGSLILDPKQVQSKYGWRARTPLEIGLKKLIEWYEVHGVSQTYTHLQSGKIKA